MADDPQTRREAALEDLVARLGFIQLAKGYNTDAGLQILQGEAPRFGPDDPAAAILVTIGDDAVENPQGGTLIRSTVPFEVWAIVPSTQTDPLPAIEAIVGDIKRAVEISGDGDRYLGTINGGTQPATKFFTRGTTRGARREEGTNYVGAAVEYVATFEEPWGKP